MHVADDAGRPRRLLRNCRNPLSMAPLKKRPQVIEVALVSAEPSSVGDRESPNCSGESAVNLGSAIYRAFEALPCDLRVGQHKPTWSICWPTGGRYFS